VAYFNIIIPAKKSFIELLCVTQQKGESTWVYFKRFNEKILKVEELLEPTFLDALINKGKEHTIWRKLYALLDKRLFKVKQVMTNYIRVEEANML